MGLPVFLTLTIVVPSDCGCHFSIRPPFEHETSKQKQKSARIGAGDWLKRGEGMRTGAGPACSSSQQVILLQVQRTKRSLEQHPPFPEPLCCIRVWANFTLPALISTYSGLSMPNAWTEDPRWKNFMFPHLLSMHAWNCQFSYFCQDCRIVPLKNKTPNLR